MTTSLLVADASESTQRVHLHPLVLLTATDLITRQRLRKLEGPLVGLLLGQQDGTQITAEHAFTAKLKDGLLDTEDNWTDKRVAQYKEVHMKPVLDLVGWFTLCPEDGPTAQHAALHSQLATMYPDNPCFMLAIHAAEFKNIDGTSGKLPLSIYEATADTDSSEGAMQIDGKEKASLRFRHVPYVIETEESEMIAINYVAKGAGSAAAVSQDLQSNSKQAADETEAQATESVTELTPDEEDQLAGMTTRLNSVRMLQQRLQLLSSFVASVPPSYVSDQSVPLSESSPSPQHTPHLREVQALLTRLSLLTPTSKNEANILQAANRSQANDVLLTSILSQLGQQTQSLSELGRKFAIVEQAKNVKGKGKGGYGGTFTEEFDRNSVGFTGTSMLI